MCATLCRRLQLLTAGLLVLSVYAACAGGKSQPVLSDIHDVGLVDLVADTTDAAESESPDLTPGELQTDTFMPADALGDTLEPTALRLPAEWEPQAATWMQWPTPWEASLEEDFARIIAVVQQYQPVHLLVLGQSAAGDARDAIWAAGGDAEDVTYHFIKYDNSWLRDNGPVYVLRDGAWEVQDWGFDAWGGNFGPGIPWQLDDAVPKALASALALPYADYNDYILERGNLETNGQGVLVLNWDCQADRNPDHDKDAAESILTATMGATQVIWTHGHDPEDGTTGHIDGTVRFVNEKTVAVARSLIPNDPNAKDMDEAAKTLAHAGFDVVRIDVPGTVDYKGVPLPAMYMNWLLGNGFVAAMAFGNESWDEAAKAHLELLFPGRSVHMIPALELWYNGGGIHCVTNDQPL